MNLERKLDLLEGIYRIHEAFVRTLQLACAPMCAACCTCNVTLTTLEGYRILSALTADQKKALSAPIRRAAGRRRFQPELTFNQIAARCLKGMDVPDEAADPLWGACPLLNNRECLVYARRPFGCRAMVSRVRCDRCGHADMEPFVLTVNNLLLQYIEHIDTPGMTGNLVDVLGFLFSEAHASADARGRIARNPLNLIPNSPMPALMIPPEHRERIRPLLSDLAALFEQRDDACGT